MSTTGASAPPTASLSPDSRRASALSSASGSVRGAATAPEPEPAEPAASGAVACQETMPRVIAARATPAEISRGFVEVLDVEDVEEGMRVLQCCGWWWVGTGGDRSL